MFKVPLLGLVAALGLGAEASAAPVLLDSYLHEYGTSAGHIDPAGSDILGSNSVEVSDGSATRFSDAFNFSALAYDTISSFNLTLTFSGAGPSLFPLELWTVRVQGANAATAVDDLFAMLSGTGSTQQVTTISAATDFATVNAFAQTLATETFGFWFSEFTGGNDKFTLASAKLDVYGTAPAAVPLPAGGVMLLGAIGGLTALRRRKAK